MGKEIERRRLISFKKLIKDSSQEEITKKWYKALQYYYKNKRPSDYIIIATIPYNEDGGIRAIKSLVTNALTPAEAIKAVAEEVGLITIDSQLGNSNYGIKSITRVGTSSNYSHKEVMDIIKLTLDMHYKQEYSEGGKNRILDNKKEVMQILKNKYQL